MAFYELAVMRETGMREYLRDKFDKMVKPKLYLRNNRAALQEAIAEIKRCLIVRILPVKRGLPINRIRSSFRELSKTIWKCHGNHAEIPT